MWCVDSGLVIPMLSLTTASLSAVHWFRADVTPPWKFPQASCREDIDANNRLSLRCFVSVCAVQAVWAIGNYSYLVT